MDIVDAEVRSRMMSNIRGKDTKPEMMVRKFLHARGLRFRIHRRDLPGRPDLVLPQWRAAVLVHGCFWHGHHGCRYFRMPATRPEFWSAKIAANVSRDHSSEAALKELGWRVLVLWECAIRDYPSEALEVLLSHIRGGSRNVTIGSPLGQLEVSAE